MFSGRYNEGHLKECLSSISKFNHEGKVIISLSLPNIKNIYTDTKIEWISGTTEICLTLIFKVIGWVSNVSFCEILGIENAKIDAKVKSVSCIQVIQPKIRVVL